MPLSSATSLLKKQFSGPLRGLLTDAAHAVATAPGRVDVLGGLAVEAGGTLAQIPLPRRAAVCAQFRPDTRLVIHALDIGPPVG